MLACVRPPPSMALLCALALGASVAPAQEPGQERPAEVAEPSYVGRAFVFRADLAAGRELGWLAPETSDVQALEEVRAVLLARLRGAGRFAEASVALEPPAGIAVTFVGDQPEEVEAFLVRGLALPGRLEVRVAADEAALEALGTTLAAERARLEAWRAAHPEVGLEAFRRLAPEAGGARAGLAWIDDSAAEIRSEAEPEAEPGAGARLVLAEPAWRFTRSAMERGLRPDPEAEPPLGLDLRLLPEPLEELRRWARGQGGRPLVVTLDGRALGELADPPEALVSLGSGYTPTELRALVFAVGDEPLPAPLAFVERSTRPLEGVRAR